MFIINFTRPAMSQDMGLWKDFLWAFLERISWVKRATTPRQCLLKRDLVTKKNRLFAHLAHLPPPTIRQHLSCCHTVLILIILHQTADYLSFQCGLKPAELQEFSCLPHSTGTAKASASQTRHLLGPQLLQVADN